MSVRYGLNGNDINWDSVNIYEPKCLDCNGGEDCEGHNIRYTGYGKNRNWSIVQNTNTNFVETFGNVPAHVFNTQYLLDLLMDIDPKSTKSKNACKELQERYNSRNWDAPKAIAVCTLYNTGGLVAWAVDSYRMVVASISDTCHDVKVCDIKSHAEEGHNNDEDEFESDEFVKFGKMQIDVGMFMRV